MLSVARLLAGLALIQGPSAETYSVWRHEEAAGEWVPQAQQSAAPATASQIVWVGTAESSETLVATRNRDGELAIWAWAPASPQPTLLAQLPTGPSEVLCVLSQPDRLWVGTDAGLYVRAGDQWVAQRETSFKRLHRGGGTVGLGWWSTEHAAIPDVSAVWPLEEGVVAFASRATPEAYDRGGVFRTPPSNRPAHDAEFEELWPGRSGPVAVALKEGTAYVLTDNLLVLRIEPTFARRLVDVDDAWLTDRATGHHILVSHDIAPSALFFDREERLWAAVSGPGGRLLLRHEVYEWAVNDEATRLLANEGEVFVTNDSDGLVYLGTERGRLFTFDGFEWSPSPFRDTISADFPDDAVPPLRPVWSSDGSLWVAAGQLLFRFESPVGGTE